MPITGTLRADFTSFYSAVQTAAAQLDTLEASTSNVEKRLTGMANAYSGTRTLEQANLAVAAVEAIGGATSLTEKEQAKLNALLTEAISKYEALGKEAPQAMVDLAAATQTADSGVLGFITHLAAGVTVGGLLKDGLEKIGEVGFEAFKKMAETLPELIGHTMELGNQLFEMSLKTGASVEGLSSLRFVASQTGIDFEAMSGSLFKMEKFLGSSGDAAVKAQGTLDKLGLSLRTLKNERADQAFIDIIAALEQIPNKADQAAAGAAIFGKGFKDMAGLASEDIHKLMQEAEDLGLVMSTRTAAAAHVAEIEYKALGMQLEAVGTRIGTAFLPAVIGIEQALQTGFKVALDAANKSLSDMGSGSGFLATVAKAMGTGDGAIAAQIKLYEYLRDGLIAVVRNGIEPMITAGAAIGRLFGEMDIIVRGSVIAYNAIKLAIADVAMAMLGLQKMTQPWNAERLNTETFAWHVMGLEAKQSMATQQLAVEGLIKADKEWQNTGTDLNASIEAGLHGVETSYVDIAKIIADAEDVSKHAHSGMQADVDTTGEKTKGFAKELEKLTEEIENAAAHGAPLSEQVRLFGQAAETAADKARAWGITVASALQAVADAFTSAKIAEMWEKTHAEMTKQANKLVEDGVAATNLANEKTADSIARAQTGQLKILTDYQKKVDDMNLSGADLKIAQIDRAHDAEMAALDAIPDHTTWAYQQAAADIDQYYGHQRDLANGTANTIEERMRAQGVHTKAELEATAAAATRDYNQMKESGEYTAAEIQAAWERMTKANQAADNVWMSELKTAWSGLPGILDSAISGGGGFAAIAKKASLGFATDFAKGVISAIPVIGQFAAPIVDGLTKVFSSMFGSAGRDAVTKFAEGMGGFDALHVKLDALGADGEALWVKLTQGVGKNNPAEAQAAIDAVTKALDAQQTQQAESTVQTEEQAQATVETATAAAAALDQVSAKLGDSQNAWKDWSTVVTGVLNDVAQAIYNMPIPEPTGALGGGAGGVLPAGSSAAAMRAPSGGSNAVNLTSHVVVDGKEIATAVSNYVYTNGLNR